MPRESDIDSSIGEKAAGSGRSFDGARSSAKSWRRHRFPTENKKHGELEPSFELVILNQGRAAALHVRCLEGLSTR